MPELPEVETVRRSLLSHVVGCSIARVHVAEPRLRFPLDPRALESALRGRRILNIRRRAKYLLFDVEGDTTLLAHLGMTGKWALVPAGVPARPHDHVVLSIDRGRELRFNDARRFGWLEIFSKHDEPQHPRLVRLGPEPLDEGFTAAAMVAASRGVQQPIKQFVMDAHRVVGVGNIYACESLFTARVHPACPAGRLSRRRWEKLVDAVRATLHAAIAQGGTTLRDFANTDGTAGYFAVKLQVYGREGQPCPGCGRSIKRVVQAGRSTFFCGGCQRR